MLKAGRDTGSLVNHLYSPHDQEHAREPFVGMGATPLSWTDREAGTIIEVAKSKKGEWIITVQEDDAKRIDQNGFSESQDYEYSANPEGPKLMFRYEDGKGWRAVRKNEKGRLVLTGNGDVLIGAREKYHDFSF